MKGDRPKPTQTTSSTMQCDAVRYDTILMSDKEIRLPDGLTVETATDILQQFATTTDAQIVNSETLDSLKNEISEAKEAFATILAEESPQSAETLSKQDMDALTEPYRDEDGNIEVDTLRQNPETGDTGEGGEGEPTGFDVDTLNHSDVEDLKLLNRKRNAFESRGVDSRVDVLESEMAEVAGVEDYEEIKMEEL